MLAAAPVARDPDGPPLSVHGDDGMDTIRFAGAAEVLDGGPGPIGLIPWHADPMIARGPATGVTISSPMALGATIYNVDVELSDTDRQVYESVELRVARRSF